MRYLYMILHLFFCPHKWHILHRGNITLEDREVVIGHYYTLQCSRCGKIKEITYAV